MSTPSLAASTLSQWVAEVLETREIPPTDALLVADALVDTSLHGVDTHGISMLPSYLDFLARGLTKAQPKIAIEERGAMLRVEADRGLGQVVVSRTLERAIALARSQGSATSAISNVGHLGALGYFARRAAGQGMLALVLQNGPPLMGLLGSTSRAIGNNPLAFGLPVLDGPPIVFDVATSEAAFGKLPIAMAAGEEIPEGWAIDKDGQPTTDPASAMAGILLPLGGAKGIGLAMLVEALAGSLTGTRPVSGNQIFGAFLLVIDPAAGHAGFAQDMATWLRTYAASATGARYPGQRAAEIYAERSRGGIPVAEPLHQSLKAIGVEAGVPLPPAV